jgi:pilus assembly protein TadC
MARAQATGAPVTRVVERLADELARAARADVEDRARAVGVKAALPLGLCLLPAFLLIGIVPLVAGLLGSLDL